MRPMAARDDTLAEDGGGNNREGGGIGVGVGVGKAPSQGETGKDAADINAPS